VTIADPAERFDLAPELRMASYAYREEFGQPPAMIGRVPGRVTLLASGPLQLTVAAPWGVIAAAGPRDDDIIELARMQRPGERETLTVADATAGACPWWAGAGLRSARAGARLLISCELPDGAGVNSGAAIEAAIRLCLADREAAVAGDSPATPSAMLGAEPLPFDLAAAGLRLVIIDARIRAGARPSPAEASPVAAAAEALRAGNMTALGSLLTAAHHALPSDDVQQGVVSTALRSGALGARAIADGPGRPVCALVPADRLGGLRAAGCAWFARQDMRPPRFLVFTPASAQRQLWHTV
jgi:galactokinase